LYNIAAHDHEHPHNGLPYQHIRSKPYPWICSDCNLFDGACWDECRAAKNAWMRAFQCSTIYLQSTK
jgi:hypothetical protein